MRRGTRIAVLAAMAAAVVALPAAGAAAKAHPQLFGVNYTFPKLHTKDLSKMSAGNVKNVRWTMLWARVERSKGQFDWSTPDHVIGELAKRGVRVLPVLYGSPHFAAKSNNTPPLGSRKARKAWQGFLTEAVKRYEPGGAFWDANPGIPAKPVKHWQIWNEPNLRSQFAPHPSPGKYAQLLKISNSAIKKQDPRASVVFAGMPGYSNDINAWHFLDRVYRTKKVSGAFDAVSLHPYSANLHYLKVEVKRVRKVMSKHGDRGKPLWITEIGWGSAHPDRYGLNKGKEGQKRMLKRSFRLFQNKRGAWHIARVFWYDFRDPKGGISGCSFCGSSGLLTHNHHPKPAWNAFRKFTGALH